MAHPKHFCCSYTPDTLFTPDLIFIPSPPPPIPEPETYLMLLTGLGLMGFMVWRRKRIFNFGNSEKPSWI